MHAYVRNAEKLVISHEHLTTAYTGKVKVEFRDKKMNAAIFREDIAAFILEQVKNNDITNQISESPDFEMST